jgi:hypothetical protein
MASHLGYDVLSRLVEHGASTLEEVKAERHLARCARCRSERDWLERVRRATSPDSRPFESEPSPGRPTR